MRRETPTGTVTTTRLPRLTMNQGILWFSTAESLSQEGEMCQKSPALPSTIWMSFWCLEHQEGCWCVGHQSCSQGCINLREVGKEHFTCVHPRAFPVAQDTTTFL